MPKSYGVCKLTGKSGALVRSHLIPKAFTRFADPLAPRIESGIGLRPNLVHDSWYDRNLVTRSGEDILERYDDFAVRELRRLKLVWSGWDGAELGIEHGMEAPFDAPAPFNSWRIRHVRSEHAVKLRLFALSLLWRAAASDMRAVTDVTLSPDRLEILREMVLAGNPEPAAAFPVTLIQFITKGGQHNQSPTKEKKSFPDFESGEEILTTFFRFYFDGLIIHIHEEPPDERKVSFGNMTLGPNNDFSVLARPFDGSEQENRISSIIVDAELNNRVVLDRIFGKFEPNSS